MRRLSIIAVLLLYALSAKPQIPQTPFSGNFLTKVPDAESVIISIHNEYERVKDTRKQIVFQREGNSVTYGNGYTDLVVEFDANGRIARFQELLYGGDEWYSYDDDGRILEVANSNRRTRYYYTNSGTDSIVSWNYVQTLDVWYLTEKEEIKYDNTGYKVSHYQYNNENKQYTYWFTSQYTFDDEKRLTEVRELDRQQSNRWTYAYTDNGYIYTVYQNSPSPFCRTEYIFNENGDLSKTIYSEWMNGSYWFPAITTTYEYKYNETGIGETGAIINLYTANGSKVVSAKGILSIELLPGLYLVEVAGHSRKIFVGQ